MMPATSTLATEDELLLVATVHSQYQVLPGIPEAILMLETEQWAIIVDM